MPNFMPRALIFSSQTALKLLGVDKPVAQAGGVAVPLAEPAVVQDHQSDAEAGGLLGDGIDLILIEIEIGCLPVVDENFAGLGGGAAAEGLPDEAMIMAGQLAQTLVGVAEQNLRGGKGLARRQQPAESVGMDAGDQTGGAVEIHFNVGAVVAGIDRHHAVTAAVVLGGGGLAENHEGVVVMAGGAPQAGHPADIPAQMGTLHLTLHGVAAVELDQVPLAEGEIQAGRGRFFQGEGLAALVGEDGCPGDDVLLLVHAVQQLKPQPDDRVPHLDGQSLAVIAERGRQPLQGIGARMNPVTCIDELHAACALGVYHVCGGHAEITAVGGRVFLGQHVGGVGTPDGLCRIEIGRKAVIRCRIEIEVGRVADSAAVIQMQQMPHGVQLHLIGGVSGV